MTRISASFGGTGVHWAGLDVAIEMKRQDPERQRRWQAAMRQAFLMAAEGMSLRHISAELLVMGITAPRGGALSPATLWRHLSDPGYAGLERSKRTFRLTEPIVSERLFREANVRMQKVAK